MELTKFINDNIIGRHHQFDGPFGRKHVIYCDFTASGKALHFIEHFIINQVLPTYGNTHTSTGINSVQTTFYRDEAREILRNSFGATKDDAVIFVGSGCTGAIHKLVDGLGLSKNDRPVVFVGASEHHSNLLPWREIASRVVRIKDDENGLLDMNELENALKIAQRQRRTLIGCFSAASNITGTLFQDMKITALLHKYGAYSFWDYATAAPYVKIAMNPTSSEYPNGEAHKDAIYFSMHKFVGGPQTPGLLIVKKSVIERNPVPGGAGGGTVLFVDRNSHHYLSDVEAREEGGTPAIVESIRAGLVIKLKDTVTDEWIMKHENKLTRLAFTEWQDIPELILLGSKTAPRIAIFSFLVRHLRTGLFLHHNFVCALLNDIYGIQARGGCACAGPFAQDLLGIDDSLSQRYTEILAADDDNVTLEILKPGFSRLNLPYFAPDEEIDFIIKAVRTIAKHGWEMLPYYKMNPETGGWHHHSTQLDSMIQGRLDNIEFNNQELSIISPNNYSINYEECLRKGEDIFQKARNNESLNEIESIILTDRQNDLIDTVRRNELRWFLLPSEAEQILFQNDPNGVFTEINAPFHPREYSKNKEPSEYQLQHYSTIPTEITDFNSEELSVVVSEVDLMTKAKTKLPDVFPLFSSVIQTSLKRKSDILDVNTTFKNKELPTMVHEQGIEFNVETAQMRVEEGTSQSATCKTKIRRRKWIIAIISIIAVIVLMIIIGIIIWQTR